MLKAPAPIVLALVLAAAPLYVPCGGQCGFSFIVVHAIGVVEGRDWWKALWRVPYGKGGSIGVCVWFFLWGFPIVLARM